MRMTDPVHKAAGTYFYLMCFEPNHRPMHVTFEISKCVLDVDNLDILDKLIVFHIIGHHWRE